MNEAEKKGCASILKKLDVDDLMLLKDTVTKKQIAAKSANEAIKIIVSFSQNSVELLKRKKICRDILFQYLFDNRVVVPPSSGKHQLITRCLKFWGSDVNQNSLQFELDDEVSTPQPTPHAQPSTTKQPDRNSETSLNEQRELNPRSVSVYLSTEINSNQHGSVSLQFTEMDPNQKTRIELSHKSLLNETPQSSICSTTSEQQIFGETFASWFYKMLNSNNPTLGQSPQDFGPDHFWNDVTLQLLTVSPQPSSDSYEGSYLVSQRFLALVKEEMLLFNPNIGSHGVSVMADVHGLTCVMVCGTLHKHNDCLGVFQQAFGLVRDPRFENNWKIKNCKLVLRSGQVISIPRLQDLPVMEAIKQ